MTKSETVVLKIQIHCENCIRKVKKALAEIDGVESIGIDVEQKKVTVVGDIDANKVLKKVKRTGKYVELLQSKNSKDANSDKKKDGPAKKNDLGKQKDDSAKQAEDQGKKKDVLSNNQKDDSIKNEAAEDNKEGDRGKQETPVKKDEGLNILEKQNISYSNAQNDMTFMFSDENPNNCCIM